MKDKIIDEGKVYYLFEGLTADLIPADKLQIVHSLIEFQNLYISATRQVITKLENLNDEFRYTKDRNPIHHISSRIKSPTSIIKKLKKKGLEISVDAANTNLTDLAGIRVTCSYIDDIYLIADLITSQGDIKLLENTDYISHPKPNGYRSLHLIVAVPVHLTTYIETVKLEIQIRTIAMDFWASLEHELSYKMTDGKDEPVKKELKNCAEVIAETDRRMQNIYNMIHHNGFMKKGKIDALTVDDPE